MRDRRSRHLTDARRRRWRTLFQVIPAVVLGEGLDRYVDPTEENALVLVPLLAWVFAYAQVPPERRDDARAMAPVPGVRSADPCGVRPWMER